MSANASSRASATVTPSLQAQARLGGKASIATNVTVFLTKIQTCNLSGTASSRVGATVTPSLQAQAKFGGRASIAVNRSISFIIRSQFQSIAKLSSYGVIDKDCTCPDWIQSVTYSGNPFNYENEPTCTMVNDKTLVNGFGRKGCG
jgi:hypothetical protein